MSHTYLDTFDATEGFNGKIDIVIRLARALTTNLVVAADSQDEEVRDRIADEALVVSQDLTDMIESLPVGIGYAGEDYYSSLYYDPEEWED